ncbi:hypothetical protein EZ449_12865 [Pedobacter frigidisoli]|uniref:Uncharacterized protein n=1 Tax=Pedobacter frigidisoli TaxID=2530455 RepID=A0A4R0P061_9SPHI|nr:FUSC family membrane protein [Pedobacter frigidisoli]TCD08291.1 hypothetical protein EZ449_12865 [Pedobacter frigidisoli]
MRNAKERNITLKALDFNNQDLADAVRNTITVIVPFSVFFFLGMPSAAMGVGTGTLLICLTDLPGNRAEKMFSAWLSTLTFSLLAVLISLLVSNIYALPFVVGGLTFLLLMMTSLGQRMGVIGMMGLGVAAFTIGLHPTNPLAYGMYIAIGGIWYSLVSLTQAWLFPYHSLKRALARTKKNTAALMRLRSIGYDMEASLAGFNAKNIKLHLKLTTDHELVRRLLLGDRFNISFEDISGKQLLKESILLIDLYEKVSALHYDYTSMRNTLAGSGILEKIRNLIGFTADKLESNTPVQANFDEFIAEIHRLTVASEKHRDLVAGIVVNLEETGALVFALDDQRDLDTKMLSKQFPAFLTEGKISFKMLKAHLTYDSQVFRFALRISLLMMAVVLVVAMLPKGSYGYWLPITLIVISRPSYGMTMKRNIERVIGTFAGLIIGWCLIALNLPIALQLCIAVLGLFLFFGFLLLRYWVSAMGITLAVVLCLSIYHGNTTQILSERLLFTLLGCLIGLAATFLFPVRHSFNIKIAVQQAISTNSDYLSAVINNAHQDVIQIKLARKQSYLALSALNEAISLVAREPKWKRKELRTLRQIELLCFQVNALTAALSIADKDLSSLNIKPIADLNYCVEKLNEMQHGQVFALMPLERLDGQLNLSNVAVKLKTIFSAS